MKTEEQDECNETKPAAEGEEESEENEDTLAEHKEDTS